MPGASTTSRRRNSVALARWSQKPQPSSARAGTLGPGAIGKRARRAHQGAAGQNLDPVLDQAPVLADRRAAGAAEADVGLAAIARVGSELKGHGEV